MPPMTSMRPGAKEPQASASELKMELLSPRTQFRSSVSKAGTPAEEAGRSVVLESIFFPTPRDQVDCFGVHGNFIGPVAHYAFAGPFARGVDADFAPRPHRRRRMIENVQRPFG